MILKINNLKELKQLLNKTHNKMIWLLFLKIKKKLVKLKICIFKYVQMYFININNKV